MSRFHEFQAAIRAHHPDVFWDSGEAGLHGLTHTQDWSPEGATYTPMLATRVPWEQAHPHAVMRRLDPQVQGSWPTAPMEDVDPVKLLASQRGLSTGGLEHYFRASDFGELWDKNRGPSNKHPIVYRNTDSGQDILLSGHHRAAASLLRGRALRALVVKGGLITP